VDGVPDRVCVATITWARNEQEEALLRRSLLQLAAHSLTVVVADKGASETFTAFVASQPHFIVAPAGKPSLVGQVQSSLAVAAQTGADFILYTESDKELFFREGLDPFLEAVELRTDTGVVLATRSDESFATFPRLQRFTERTINELCAEGTGIAGDYSYGPFLMHRQLAAAVADLGPELGWGWRHFVFGTAARRGYTVTLVPGHYPCPLDQREEDDGERIHRLKQLAENVHGLVAALRGDG
jgi:hypothetical protein